MNKLPTLSRVDYYRLREEEFLGALAHAMETFVQANEDAELSDRQIAIHAWARMAGDVPNGGFAQFFYNHNGDLGVPELAKLFVALKQPKLATVIRDALKVYRKHKAEFDVENPFDGLFGSIKEFDKLDRALAVVRGTRVLEPWIRTNINKLAISDVGDGFEPNFNGTVETLHPNGVVAESLEVKKGKANGAYRTFFDDGTVIKGMFYKGGKVSGDFWPSGQVKRKQSKQGKLIVIEWYHPGGQLQKRYVRNKDGYAVEPIRLYHENGQLAEEVTMVKDDRRGPWLRFFDDGSPRLEAEYKSRENVIVRNAWTADRKQTVKNGKGVFHNDSPRIDWEYDIYWRGFGIEAEIIEVRDGLPHGKKSEFVDGVLEYETQYRNGVMDGKHTWYWKSGRVRSVTTYKNGRIGTTKDYPRIDNPVPAVVLEVEADERLYTAWEHMPVNEYPTVLNADEIQSQFAIPTFLQEVHERNLAKKKRDSDYEDWQTFNDGIAYFLFVDEKGVVTHAHANGSGMYSGGHWDTYLPLLHKLRFTPGRIRGRAVPCQVLARVDHTFVEGKK